MSLHNVLLNNKISFVLLEDNNAENIIYCNSFADYLFNVAVFKTKTKEVILEYTVVDNDKYVTADVTLENGDCYPGVQFKIVVNENVETPHSTINLIDLKTPHKVTIKQDAVLNEQDELHDEHVQPAVATEDTVQIETPDNVKLFNRALQQERMLAQERQQLEKQKIILDKQNIINNKLVEYKQELLQEYVDAVDRQKNILQSEIKETLTLAEHELNERITNTFGDYDVQLEDHKNKSRKEQLAFILDKIDVSIVQTQQDLNDLIDGKFALQQEHLHEALHSKSQSLEKQYEQKLIVELEQHKEALFEEFRIVSDDRITQLLSSKKQLTEQEIVNAFADREKLFTATFSEKLKTTSAELSHVVQEFADQLPGITNNIVALENRVKKLLEEKTKQEQSGKFNDTQQKYIVDTAQYWARRILELGGGGGSVAAQYANGGTMNGDLNVTSNYLSGGVNLLDIFVTSETDSQTLSFNENTAQLSISNGNTVSLSALSGEFTDRLVNGSHQVVLSGNGDLTLPGAIVTASNSKLDLVGFGPNKAYLTTTADDSTALYMATDVAELRANTTVSITTNTGVTPRLWEFGTDGGLKFPDNTTQTTAFTGDPDSSNWDSVYTSVKDTSANWNSNYTTTNTNSAYWSEAYSNLTSNSAAYLSAVDISLLAAASGSWNSNYTTVNENSAYWADTRYDVTFGQNVTINGNLTALGTSTFKNTIFTTTSALSVINTGPGPALYVYQAAGASDVASFYDGDGVEVLHVGNANVGQGGKVGINESFPAAELTVNGAISANKEITVSGGNSNQWNSNYTTTNLNSANWSSAYTSVANNSSSWDSAYTNLVSNSSNYLSGASLSYVNTNFVKISGDNMTGPLTVTGSLSTTQGIVCAPSAFTAFDTVSDAALIMDFTRGAATGGMYVRRSNGQQRSIFNYQDSTGNIDVGTFSNNINSVSIKAGGGNLTGYINLGTFSTNNAMRIIDSGNIGMGTITPSEKLTVMGNISASGTLSGAKMELLPAAANGMLIRASTTASAQDACHIVVRPISSTANVATAINLRSSGGSGEVYDGYICSSNGVINVGGSGVSTIFRVTNGNSGPNSGSSQFSVNALATVNVDIANSNAAATVLRVTGSTAQTGNLTEWRNVTPTTLAFITPTGAFSTVSTISSQSTGFFNHVAAATKSFYIPHPTKPDMHLQYGSLESPYHGVRLTGNGSVKSGDSVVVSLPDYIFSLVHQEGVNIQLTNYQHNKTLFVDDIDVKNNTFTVKCEKKLFDKGEYKFFWSFTAIRKDIPHLTVEC